MQRMKTFALMVADAAEEAIVSPSTKNGPGRYVIETVVFEA